MVSLTLLLLLLLQHLFKHDKKFSKADVVVYITIELNFLTIHNKTNIRILHIYTIRNSAQYITIIYVT